MEPATWGFIGTLLGTIVGASASILATYLNGKNSVEIQKSTEKFKRDEFKREFQRNNLLKLQDEFTSGMRLIGRAHNESFHYYHKNKERKGFRLSEEVDVGLNNMFQTLTKLTERVNNDKLRNGIINIRKDMSAFLVSEKEIENKIWIGELATKFESLMSEMGKELRNNQ